MQEGTKKEIREGTQNEMQEGTYWKRECERERKVNARGKARGMHLQDITQNEM